MNSAVHSGAVLRSALLAALLITPGSGALAVCPRLPAAELRALDDEIDHDPNRAIDAAHERLRSLREHPDALREAQLLAVIAEAQASESPTDATRATVREALATQRLRVQLRRVPRPAASGLTGRTAPLPPAVGTTR